LNVALGDVAIALALAASLAAGGLILAGILKRDTALLVLGRRLTWVVLGASIVSFAVMERALITRDFTVLYVADNGSSATSAIFNFSTAWAALEGSILLWGMILAGYLVVVATKFRGKINDPLVGWALIVMLGVCVFFFGLMVGPADPFQSFDAPPGYDGPGPNPLLQNNILMAFHPPMLYLGYVGFTVPYAFAIAALITGRLGEGWLMETRRWTLFAWGFLTLGVVLGAWWSYDTLGWGGYWAWDPVENASFLPWLTATAFIHSVMVQERRGMLRVWNISLVCATFCLTILGTFITRSGVLESVHAFTESSIGPALLAFFFFNVALTVILIGWRGDRLRAPGSIDSPISREGAFFANNLLFAVFAFIVLLGTIFPLIAEAANGDRVSVGAPYFTRMTMPVGMLLLFLMAVAPVLPWRKASKEVLSKRLHWPAWGGTIAVLGAVLLGARGLAPLIAFGLAGFAAGAAIRQVVLATRRQGLRGLVGRANGGMIVHLGVIMIAVALAASSSYLRQAEFALEEGESVTFAGSEVTFVALEQSSAPDRIELRAILSLEDGPDLKPGVIRYVQRGQSIGDPDTHTTLTRDIQISVVRLPDETDGRLVIRITEQPLIVWLWIGGGVMVFGTILAAFPGRRRRPTDPVSAPLPAEPERIES
jgi:cytochrome c-type biogenesis protein CcmF